MQERRRGKRLVISFPIRMEWKDADGNKVSEEGLTENIGLQGALVYLPKYLPVVGGKVNLIVTENPNEEVMVKAEVIRVERNPAHPQAALQLTESLRLWKKEVFDIAAKILAEKKPDDHEDW